MKKLPIGIQTFRTLIEDGYLYVDKTEDIHNLLTQGGKYNFISRPRRFGKSLLISVLKELFSGNKELFDGLWIYDKMEWKSYPVIHLDFLGLKYGNPEELMQTLEYMLDQNAHSYDIQLKENGYDKRFKELIQELAAKSKGNGIVILVDEYDKPIINLIDNPSIAKENRDVLRTFYETIKGEDAHLEFVFITGVSKFSKVSIFSGLNNLDDITLDERFPTLLGYTQEELEGNFEKYIDIMAKKLDISRDELLKYIREWYNGYSWDGRNFLYNPLSILQLFSKNAFDNYWFATGTPTFLTKLIKEKRKNIGDFEMLKVGSYIFESFDIESIEVASLLFQTGYLTVKEKKVTHFPRADFWLSYPNREVRESFIRHLLKEYSGQEFTEGARVLDLLVQTVEAGQLKQFFEAMKSLFAAIPYNIFIADREAYYQTVVYLVLSLLGMNVDTEVQTNVGRIDAVIRTEKRIYVMEFKTTTSDDALAQIKEKKYYEKYMNSGLPITLVGIGFESDNRNLSDYMFEDL